VDTPEAGVAHQAQVVLPVVAVVAVLHQLLKLEHLLLPLRLQQLLPVAVVDKVDQEILAQREVVKSPVCKVAWNKKLLLLWMAFTHLHFQHYFLMAQGQMAKMV
jgi:hypothetical protein